MFNSNTLMENANTHTNSNSLLEFTSKNTEYPYEYALLELNDILHDLETEYQIKKYKGILESINLENNGVTVYNEGLADIAEKIIKTIRAIIDFIANFVKNIFGIHEKTTENFNNRKAETRGFQIEDKETLDRTYTFIVRRHPNLSKIDPNTPRASINNLIALCEKICVSNITEVSVDSSQEQLAFKALRKLIKTETSKHEFTGDVVDSESFKKYVSTNLIYTEKVEMTAREWLNTCVNDAIREHAPKTFAADKTKLLINDLKALERKVRQEKNNLNSESIKAINSYLAMIRRIVDAWCWYINLLDKSYLKNLNYISGKHATLTRTAKNIAESTSIHGEEFDSDTLFANEDMRDFNRTEWMDLQLTTEFYEMKFEIMECHRRIAIQEAIILADNKPDKIARLNAMREAEEGKVKVDIGKIMEQIKTIINKFTDTVREKININANFIKQNEKDLMAKPFGQDWKGISKGDIIAGMYRVQEPITFVPFDLNRMKDDLGSKEAFFQKYIIQSLNKQSQFSKRNVKWQDGMTIAEFCKAYYGASMSEDKYPPCEFKSTDMETNKGNIIKFLENPNFVSSIKRDMSKIEAESKKSASTVASGTSDSSQQNSSGSSTQESYISVLFNTILTEIDIDAGKTEGQSGDGDNGAANESSGIKTYVNAYKDVMMSKITASEFIISEMMAIMRQHSGKKTNSEQKMQAAQNTQSGNQNQ